ncbi:hypothetical protein Tco_0848746, partial [Tanacetum coccineum]
KYGDSDGCTSDDPILILTYNTASATLRSNIMIKKNDDLKESSKITQVQGTKLKDHYLMYKDKFNEVVQRVYDAILQTYPTIKAMMKASEAYKTYHDLATGKVQPKPKYVRRSSRSKTEQAPKPSTGKRVKATAKVAKSGKKKKPAPGLETLSDIALTEAEQMKIATKRSLIQTHNSHVSGSGAHEGTGVTPGVPDVPTYESDDEEISWKTSSDDDDDNEGDDDAANDDHDDADNQKEKEEESSDPRVHTPSQSEPSDNEENVDVAQSEYTEEEEVNAEHTYEEEDANDLYKDLNVNLEGRDADMTDAPQTTQVVTSENFRNFK